MATQNDTTVTKECTACNTEKPLSEFHKDTSRKDGRKCRCKPCHRAARREFTPEHRVCDVAGCGGKHSVRGYCGKHYQRWKKHGCPDTVEHIRGDDDARFDSHVELIPETSCHWWTGTTLRLGYGQVDISGKGVPAHRYAYARANGPIPKGLFVCHSCDNPSCVNPEHLFIGTNADNVADKMAKGRQSRGEKSGNAKITASDVIEMRRRLDGGEIQSSVADDFGVGQQQVSRIFRRKSWKHIQPKESPQ